MPKPPSKKAKLNIKAKKLPIRDLAIELDDIRLAQLELSRRLNALHQKIHTTGLDDTGPITECESDIPF